MGLKQKIQQEIVLPADHIRGTHTTVGEIIESFEKANVVTVKFIDKEGYAVTKHGVPVKLYNTAIIDWFPVKGEAVVVEQTDDFASVTSKYEGSYTAITRQNTLLKNDILGDTFSSTMSGFIL